MVKSHILNGPHAAGIFADMSIDGPEIGTLIVIVDRAKNLPNRKKIGKQDPYCAARLGKEANKTTTDIRGGQTPKWDQELRFTVHDSPDYYQLKLSVFNDDKKTELIGETWIDLRDIIIPGGGQNDDWQNLSCKGKYAGDIRIEITYYDTRPKPEKPAAKPKPVASESDALASLQKAPRRRPLPSDPYTGLAPDQPPQPAPSHVPTPPRPQPNLPREYPPEHHIQNTSRAAPQSSPSYPANHTASRSGQYGTPPSLRNRHADNYSSGPGSAYHTPPSTVDASRGSLDEERYPVYPDDLSYSPDHQGHTPDMRYTSSAPYGAIASDPVFGADIDDERPPPPPAHRIAPGATPEVNLNPGRDVRQQSPAPPIMRKDVLRNEAHRQSAESSAYPGRPIYRAYDSAPVQPATTHDPHASGLHQASPPRHHSYDAPYDSHHKSLQPTVEDVPDSPGSGLDDYKRGGSRAPPYDEVVYRKDPSPAPLNLSGRNSAPAVQYNPHHGQSVSPDYARSDLSSRASAPQTSYDSRSSYAPYANGQELDLPVLQTRASDHSVRFDVPAIPASLIPGMDPVMSMEISHRINDDGSHERRHTQPAPPHPPVGSMRGRQMVEPPPNYSAPPPETSHYFNPPPHDYGSYDRSPVHYSDRAPSQQAAMRNEVSPTRHSPSGHNTIKRKSVSPAPPPAENRLSGIPFGPDSYDALNPIVAASKPKESTPNPDYDEINGKIITYDGREVDPSDHLPMDTWAPEPEPKGGKKSLTDSGSSRPSLSGPQPPPPSARKALRIREARPTSSLPPATYITSEQRNSLPPPGTGRNRLQKKMIRNSAMPAMMMSGANGPGDGVVPTPLAPLSQTQDRDNFAPRAPTRASTFDYENYTPPPMYDMPAASSHRVRDHSASAPPVPAKIPIAAAAGALVPMGYGHGGGNGDMSLIEEMSRIDIGTGRARRHAHRPTIGGY